MNSMSGEKLKGIPYTGTLPAVLTGTKAGYLHRYKVYGNTEQVGTPTPENPIMPQECGERTENLVGINRLPSTMWTIDEKYYIDGAVGDNKSNIRPDMVDASISNSGDLTVTAKSYYGAGFVVAVTPSTPYTISFLTDITVPNDKTVATITYIDANENFLYYATVYGGASSTTFVTPGTAKYILIIFRYISNTITFSDIMLVPGSTAPSTYIPFGYKLPLTSAGQDVDIYIGDDTLSTGEYVDSGTGKIYRMVSGVLTPVDPPVPFPQIPTSAGSTTISWAGEGLAPSEFDSVQEWVDIPTYKRVNGAWVADN